MKKLLVLLFTLCISIAMATMFTGCVCNHDWKLKDQVDATCATVGVANYQCSKCNDKKTENLPIDENAHNFDGENCLGCNVNVWDYALNHVKSQTNFTEGTNYTVSYYVDNELYGTVMASDNTMYFKEKAEAWWIYEDNIIKMYTYNDGQWQYEELNDVGHLEISIEYIIAEIMMMDYVYDKEKDLFVNEENGVNVTISNGKFVSFVTVDGGNGYFFEFGNTVIEEPEFKKQQETEEEFKQILSKYAEFAQTQVSYTEGTNYVVCSTYESSMFSGLDYNIMNFTADAYYMESMQRENSSSPYIWYLKTDNGFVKHVYYPGVEYIIDENLSSQDVYSFGISLLSLYCDLFGSATSIKKVDEGIFELEGIQFDGANWNNVKATFVGTMLKKFEYELDRYKYIDEFSYGNAKVPRVPNSGMSKEEWNECFDVNKYINSTISSTIKFSNVNVKIQTEINSIIGKYKYSKNTYNNDERINNEKETNEDVNNEYIKNYIIQLAEILIYENFEYRSNSTQTFENKEKITVYLEGGKFICYETISVTIPYPLGVISWISIKGYQNFNPIDGSISETYYNFTEIIHFEDIGTTEIQQDVFDSDWFTPH